jgi:hypothetical protein
MFDFYHTNDPFKEKKSKNSPQSKMYLPPEADRVEIKIEK